jgi:hypothetical protein
VTRQPAAEIRSSWVPFIRAPTKMLSAK